MSNTYFRFKQFIVHQDRCAMKVCTDACLLGAWFARHSKNYQSILDIGSGTGLLMLMLAQKSGATIDGIEIDHNAFEQLNQNITASRWRDRLHAYEGDVTKFSFEKKYDFIITNPPFYENDLQSPQKNRNLAMHSSELTLTDLITSIRNLLNADAEFGILLPFQRSEYFKSLAHEEGFNLVESINVRHTAKHSPFRSIMCFSLKASSSPQPQEIIIRDSSNEYSGDFKALLTDYYLHL